MTHGVIITNTDIAMSSEMLGELSNKLQQILDINCFWIAVNPTPYNKTCEFSPIIYAIDRRENECIRIIEKIEALLTEMGFVFERFETALSWNDTRLFIEVKR